MGFTGDFFGLFQVTSKVRERKSVLWLLPAVFFPVLGGLIAFYFLKQYDPNRCKDCLVIGVAMGMVIISWRIIEVVTIQAIPDVFLSCVWWL